MTPKDEAFEDFQTDLANILGELVNDSIEDVTEAAHEIALLLSTAAQNGATREDYDEIEANVKLIAEARRLELADGAWETLQSIVGLLLGGLTLAIGGAA